MRNKIIINQPALGSKKLLVDREIDEIKKILDRIEKEIHGQYVTESCRTLILRGLKMANGNLSGVISFKKISDQDKRK